MVPAISNKELLPKKFVTFSYAGSTRTGNRLFKFAAAFALSETIGAQLVVDENLKDLGHIFDFTNISINSADYRFLVDHSQQISTNKCCMFYPDLFKNSVGNATNITLNGYFITFKYFHQFKGNLMKKLKINMKMQQNLAKRLELVLSKQHLLLKSSTRIGIHVRRGELEKSDSMSHGYTLATIDYFYKAMNHFR